jgi:hypothetical protein
MTNFRETSPYNVALLGIFNVCTNIATHLFMPSHSEGSAQSVMGPRQTTPLYCVHDSVVGGLRGRSLWDLRQTPRGSTTTAPQGCQAQESFVRTKNFVCNFFDTLE